MVLALCAFVCVSHADAQQLHQPASLRTVSVDYDYYALADDEDEIIESPSDRVLPDDPAPAGGGCESAACDKGGERTCPVRRLGACMCQGEHSRIWSNIFPCKSQCSSIQAGGWFQLGYHTAGANGDGTGRFGIYPTRTGMFNNYPNRVQVQQAWIWLEKALDPDRCGWDWGFRMDYAYGTDAPDTQAVGGRPTDWDNNWDSGGFYGHAIPQLYFEVAYNDLTVKMGHFYTIGGYEVVQAPENFFYSHSFTMVNAEPFTHTGVLAEYQWSDNITLFGGWTAGWDTGFTRNFGDVFLGGFALQLRENVSLTYTATAGNFGFAVGGFGSDDTGYSHSVVIDWAVTDRLNYVLQTDYVDNDILMFGPGVIDKTWGVNQYLLYDINDCVAIGGRLEYYDDERFVDQVVATTFGMNIKPHRNVILRPEVRWEDWGPTAFRNDATLFAMDMIILF